MRANLNAALPTSADTHVPVGSLVTVSIGRNVGDTPMAEGAWAEFISEVSLYVGGITRATARYGPFLGTGEWNGVAEDTATLTFITGRPVAPSDLGDILSALSRLFNQDAIAWSYGPAFLALR